MSWKHWRERFAARAHRPLPPAAPPRLDEERAAALLRSLRIFQLGETGEGRIVHQVRRDPPPGTDADYQEALRLFVAEEGRHAAILGRLIRSMGSEPLSHSWTHRLFEGARHLIGVRTKLLVLLSAEVIAVGFYGALADRLPAGPAREALDQIRADEADHLAFHADFFRRQLPTPAHRASFVALWLAAAGIACLTVAADHHRTLRRFEVPWSELLTRCAEPTARAAHRATRTPARKPARST